MNITEAFEGENSSLKKTFDSVPLSKEEEIAKEFEKLFGEEFYNLHYRFCSIIPDENQKKCTDYKNKLQSEIVKYIFTFYKEAIAEEKENTKKIVEKYFGGIVEGKSMFYQADDANQSIKDFIHHLTQE